MLLEQLYSATKKILKAKKICSKNKIRVGLLGKVNLTGGNRSGLTGYRSNRSGPVPVSVSVGTQPAKIKILNLNSKNEKFPKNS